MDGYNGWMLEAIARTRQEAWLHEAELYRMERLALSLRPQRAGLVTRILYQLGRMMAAWGSRLEERYRSAGELSVAAAGNPR
jgi:hypothetical protein